jgi:colanic acid/amylovoran biosynthesis glycosyltransferase
LKKVLHLERIFGSGTETFIRNQINTIKGFNVVLGCLKNKNRSLLNENVETIDCGDTYNISKYYFSLNNSKKLKTEVEKINNISLIHTHYLVDARYFSRLTRKLKVPKIVSLYGYDISSFPKRFMGLGKYYFVRTLKEYDYFLAMSEDMKRDLLKVGCPEEKIVVHYYGTETNRFYHPLRKYNVENTINILSLGTVEEKKAQNIVLEALNVLKNKYNVSNFRYDIVGGGDVNGIKELTNRLNLDEHVNIHGFVEHNDDRLLDFYKRAHIFTHPSVTSKDGDKEGIPGTIVEAMASGLPVISTYHAGIPYIIENEKEGLLVKERDVDELANALYRLVTDSELCEKLGRNAQKRAIEELSLEKGTRELEEIYERAIREKLKK